jgi:(1->4)-alpha-D-glucan 1-alpha-D-glucosylmutase
MLRGAEYLPLQVRGAQAQQVVAFARRAGDAWLVVIVGRLYASIGRAGDRAVAGTVGQIPMPADWADTAVVWPEALAAQAPWLEDAISGRRHALQGGFLMLTQVLTVLPVAALFGVLPRTDASF